MMVRIKHLWSLHPVVTTAFAIACAAFLYFTFNTITATIYWMDPAHQDQRLSGWMTPRYVAQSYELPPDVLGLALFLVRGDPVRRESLDTIATKNDVSLTELQNRVDEAATAWRNAERDPKQ